MESLHSTSTALVAAALAPSEFSVQSSAYTCMNVALPMESCVGSVALVDVGNRVALAFIQGHTDNIICLRGLPNGDLVTVGGKKDASMKVWGNELWISAGEESEKLGDDASPTTITEPTQILGEMGYVFDLAVLPDRKPGSSLFALAGARYNRIQILI